MKYNKEQLAAIEAGEAAISPADLAQQAQLRRDPFVPQYLDDFSKIEPVIDKKVEKLRGEGQDYENSVDYNEVPEDNRDFADIDQHRLDKEFMGEWKIHENEQGEPVWVYEGWKRELDYFADKEFKETAEFTELMQEHFSKISDGKTVPNTAEAIHLGTLDTSKHPKYLEIRARLEAAGPQKRKYGFGSTESDRAIERIIQGVEPDVAPDIPKIVDPTIRWARTAGEGEEDQDSTAMLQDEELIAWQRLSKKMGQSIETLRKYRTKRLVSHRVVNQTHLGKIQSIYTLTVAGNRNGMVGLGEGKADEGGASELMAQLNAIRNMVPVLRYENRTVYGEVVGKSGAAVVQLSARHPGFGLRTNAHIFEIARCAGLQDLAARVPRSRNAMNVVKATWQALKSQRDPEDIARGRGKKLVDVRKTYYSGMC